MGYSGRLDEVGSDGPTEPVMLSANLQCGLREVSAVVDSEAGASSEQVARPACAVVMAVMWAAPAVPAAYWFVDYVKRGNLHPNAIHFVQTVTFLAAAAFCLAVAIGAWRVQRWAWWAAVVMISSAISAALLGIGWVIVASILGSGYARGDQSEAGLAVLIVFYLLAVILFLLIGLLVPLNRNCRRAFKAPGRMSRSA